MLISDVLIRGAHCKHVVRAEPFKIKLNPYDSTPVVTSATALHSLDNLCAYLESAGTCIII